MPAISVDVQGEAKLNLSDAARDHLYRIARGALTNAVRHAHAPRVDIVPAVGPGHVTLTVRDDGVGMARDAVRGPGLGLASMRHRAAATGACRYVPSSSGEGTNMRVELPQGPAA